LSSSKAGQADSVRFGKAETGLKGEGFNLFQPEEHSAGISSIFL
jgi:hypothetical protein